MSKNVLIIRDFLMGKEKVQFICDFLRQYDARVQIVEESPGIDMGGFAQAFRLMEKQGPDALPFNERVAGAMRGANIVLAMMSPVQTAAVNAAPQLEAVCLMRSGTENVDVANAAARGIKVVCVPGRLSVPVSEFTVGLIIAEMKNIVRGHNRVLEGNFDHKFPNARYSRNIHGSVVGLVGLGAVGGKVARTLKAMGADILVYDPYLPEEEIRRLDYTPCGLEELCAASDIISVHFRLTPETRGLIGEKQFRLMRPGCFFVNTARAGLVEEAALVDALRDRKIAGAALDVFHEEPLPKDHPFYTLDNVTLTSHMAGSCNDTFGITFDIMAGALKRYFETGEWINAVC